MGLAHSSLVLQPESIWMNFVTCLHFLHSPCRMIANEIPKSTVRNSESVKLRNNAVSVPVSALFQGVLPDHRFPSLCIHFSDCVLLANLYGEPPGWAAFPVIPQPPHSSQGSSSLTLKNDVACLCFSETFLIPAR